MNMHVKIVNSYKIVIKRRNGYPGKTRVDDINLATLNDVANQLTSLAERDNDFDTIFDVKDVEASLDSVYPVYTGNRNEYYVETIPAIEWFDTPSLRHYDSELNRSERSDGMTLDVASGLGYGAEVYFKIKKLGANDGIEVYECRSLYDGHADVIVSDNAHNWIFGDADDPERTREQLKLLKDHQCSCALYDISDATLQEFIDELIDECQETND